MAESAAAVSREEEACLEEASDSASVDQKIEALIQKLNQNPALLTPSLTIIAACDEGRCEQSALMRDVETSLAAHGALPIQPISSIIDMLARADALETTIEVDGIPYEGTLADLVDDETVTEESEVLTYAEATEVGRRVAARQNPSNRVANLLLEKPEFQDAFIRTLELCDCAQGLKAKQLESALDAEGYLYRDSRNLPTVYPSMYANYLRDAGALRWDHAWITTPTGRAAVHAFRA